MWRNYLSWSKLVKISSICVSWTTKIVYFQVASCNSDLFVLQHSNSHQRNQFSRKPFNLKRNWPNSYFWLWSKWSRSVAMFRGPFTLISFILRPIRAMRFLNCHFQCGEWLGKFILSNSNSWSLSKHKSFLCVSKRLPFAWRNPFGFSAAIAIQFTMMSYAAMIGACIIAFAFGFYLYTTAMTKCIRGSLFLINRSAQSKNNRKNIDEQLVELIWFHSRVKQLSILLNMLINDFEYDSRRNWNVDPLSQSTDMSAIFRTFSNIS